MPLEALPTKVAVYQFEGATRGGDVFTIKAQLDIDGKWWPFPYSFSGWRESELMTFNSIFQTGVKPDAPNRTLRSKREAQYTAALEVLFLKELAYRRAKKRARRAYRALAKVTD